MSSRASNSTLFSPDTLPTPDTLIPNQIRVVVLQSSATEVPRRFDCYEFESEEKMFRLIGDEVQVCAIDWADTSGPDPEVEVCWKGTGLSYWEVNRILVFSWPRAELIRIYHGVE